MDRARGRDGGLGLVGAAREPHHRKDADGDDHQRCERPVLEGAARGVAVDERRERLGVEGPQQERRRQLLQAVDEDEQGGASSAGRRSGSWMRSTSSRGFAPRQRAASSTLADTRDSPAASEPVAIGRKRTT